MRLFWVFHAVSIIRKTVILAKHYMQELTFSGFIFYIHVFFSDWHFLTSFVCIVFFITYSWFHRVIIPPCFSLPVARGAWNDSTSACVLWKSSRRHLSQVITNYVCVQYSEQGTAAFILLHYPTWSFIEDIANFIIPLLKNFWKPNVSRITATEKNTCSDSVKCWES